LSFQRPSDLLELKRALVASQHQLKLVQQQLETLKQSNAGLRQKVIRLAKKCNRARHFAYHDELTGLPTRRLLLDRLKQAMVQSVRQHKQVALLFVDLDRFKSINDRFGHFAGDQLLQQVAGRLTACIRFGDTVCRYGGDEFVVMLTGVDAQESAAVLADKIRVRLSPSFVLDGHVI
jgi:diguanylate cyclase